jgi:hypothetical protein
MTPQHAEPIVPHRAHPEPVLGDGFSPPADASQPSLGDGIEQSMVSPPVAGSPVPDGKSEF